MKPLKSLMFVGTASDVGKSIITTGVCRILKQDGYNPAPFKAQNMSLNSYATPEGYEIGRAQAVQAEACGIPCHTDMNPVLLKPTNDQTSQVILNGKPIGTQSSYDYFMGNNRAHLLAEARLAYDRLKARYNPIVLEGAGSISELNLKHRDITNMKMAAYANADTYLIADIDKGGVFGSVFGTIKLQTKEELSLIKGIIVNKFRGDARLFEDGRKTLEEICGVPVIGVIPYFKNITIEEEDSVALTGRNKPVVKGRVNIAVVLLKRMSNYTDFSVLEKDNRVNLIYTEDLKTIESADIIVLPGSKNTIEDLIDIKNKGIGDVIINAVKANKTVIGICGGYQMMGLSVADPFHVEGEVELMTGLGILPIETVLTEEKLTKQCQFTYKENATMCHGYEIHMGVSKSKDIKPLNKKLKGELDGYIFQDNCWGTYIHGILDNQVVIDDLLAPYTKEQRENYNHHNFKESQYDALAAHLRKYLDMNLIYKNLSL